jgi:transcription factor C subunit 6
MDASNRKSSRRKQPSKRYTVDAFEGLDIGDGVSLPLETPDDEDEDADFHMDPNASPEPPDEDLSADGAAEEDDDEEEEYQSPHDLISDEELIVGGSEIDAPTITRGFKRVKFDEIAKMKGDPRYNPRGLLEPAARGSKELQRLFFFGPAKDDQMPALKSHYRWGAELTIPSHEANAGGFGGFKTSYYHSDAATKTESEDGWEWYEKKGGKESFECHQKSSSLSSQSARDYTSPAAPQLCKVLMGPYKRQSLFELKLHESLNLNDPWVPPNSSVETPAPAQDAKSLRNGWMLNLGEKVQHLEWAPNIQGSRQFLAVTTSPLLGSDPEEQKFAAPYAPAFAPRPPSKSSIQIWEFRATPQGRIDTAFAPFLRKTLCSEWGDVKMFKWCPMPRKSSPEQPPERMSLGTLAGVWADGALRVLDVFVRGNDANEAEYELLESAAFTAQPPNTICTCLTWLSSTSVIAGCANGCVGVWNIPSSLQSASTNTQPIPNAEPVIFSPLSPTYILNVTTCYPSRPNIMISSSMSGHIQMTDLTEMTSKATMTPSATVRASRSRVGRSVLVWHEFAQVILTVDDNFTLIAYPIRRFFRQISFTRYKSSVACLAYSPVHPFVMAGCVGGEAISNNPLRRAYENKVPIWNQTWFTHEWRQSSTEELASIGTSDGDEIMVDASNGSGPHVVSTKSKTGPTTQEISRVLEGFKCKEIKLFNTEDAFTHRENGAVYSTVYDLKTSIKSMSWNPNLHVGGWIAAGIANGLVRVEDVAS